MATLLAGCAAPSLSRAPLIGHNEPATVEVAQSNNSAATTVVAYRPVSADADPAELPSLDSQAVEAATRRDPFGAADERPDVGDEGKRDSTRQLLGQTLFRDPGLSAPFAIRSAWLDVQRDNLEAAASMPIVPDSPRSVGRLTSVGQRFERALASGKNVWCRFRMGPPREESALIARANGYDEPTEFSESLSDGYSSPCPECGANECECDADDCNGCGMVEIEGDCHCCRPRRLSFRQDMYDAIRIGKADFVDLLTVQNAVVLGLAGGAAAIIHRNGDPQVRDWTAEHPDRWGHATNFLGDLGNPWVQGGMLTGVYAYGLWTQDDEIHELSLALVGAWKITAVGTVALKYIVETKRPSDDHIHSVWEGGQYGFPSIEASTSFAMAAVFDSFYGLKAGIPAYMLAGLISWSRIDTRDSDVSDVVFGAVFGYVVGKSVAIHHIEKAYGFKLQPYTHPTSGAPGISLNFAF